MAEYLQSIIYIFIIPDLILSLTILRKIPKKPFVFAIFLIAFIGWSWSFFVSYFKWWSFSNEFVAGIYILHHLPIEEIIFYPSGGMLSILLYFHFGCRSSHKVKIAPRGYWSYLILGSSVFILLAWLTRHKDPYYLYSQILVFGILCSFLLAPITTKNMDLNALFPAIGILGVIGLIWDYIGVSQEWWRYHCITEIKVFNVPIDEFNFFLFAPTSAISIYLSCCKVFCVSPLKEG
jgi:lycopene cyclase domain-containing protein